LATGGAADPPVGRSRGSDACRIIALRCTYGADRAAYNGLIRLPSWVLSGSADSARIILATVAAAIITLVSVGGGAHGDFVPHLAITVTLVLTLADVGVLIYFLNHIATMIQLPVVIASIAGTLAAEIAAQDRNAVFGLGAARGPSSEELLKRLAESGAPIRTPRSGYHRCVSRTCTGHFVRLRSIGRDRAARIITGGQ
jgi:uncharacterized membrane protein